jgi:hypothetical protein
MLLIVAANCWAASFSLASFAAASLFASISALLTALVVELLVVAEELFVLGESVTGAGFVMGVDAQAVSKSTIKDTARFFMAKFLYVD